MRTLSITTICLLILSSISVSQTNVDRLRHMLDSIGMAAFDNWKASPDLKLMRGDQGDPTKPGYDDSQWDNLTLNQSIYPDSCWIRKEITIPSRYLGQPIKGPITLSVSVDDYGYLWVNGESKGYFPWDGEFELTKDARPGEKFLIVIKAINTGGPLRLIRAEMRTTLTSSLKHAIENISLSFRVGQKLLGFDTYQTNARIKVDPKVDKSKMTKEEKERLVSLLQEQASRLDVDALGRGDTVAFMASLNDVRARLVPVKEFAKRFTLFFDANAHIDAAWLWRDCETKEVCHNTFNSVLDMMDVRPDFTYTQSAAAYYDWMEKLYPDLFERMRQRVQDGRWEVVGGMWVEPDCNLPSGESWMRHLLYSKRYFKKKFGAVVKIGWNPDSFGYNWNMPEFYLNAGIDAFITQKIGWNERNVFPYRVFWWESPDGSRVLSYFPFDYVNTVNDPFRLVDWMRQFDANTGLTKMMILFGVGDHGGGPTNDMLDRIDHLKSLDIYPTIEYGTTQTYLDWLKAQDIASFPVWKDELYLEYHQGTYTTQAKMKEWNRKSEALLTNAEKFSTLATLYGGTYNSGDLEEAWRNVLFNQFHDILPGSGIRENYIDATEKYNASNAIGTFELRKSLEQLAAQINTSTIKKGTPFVVFNSLSWERSDLVTYQLPEGDAGAYAVFDLSGKEVPSQIVSKDKYTRQIIFKAATIPSAGYKLYELRKQKPSQTTRNLAMSRMTVENEFFRVTLDTVSGWIKNIIDKRIDREILAGDGNELQLLEDKPKDWDAWNVGLTGVKYPTRLRKIELVENGPVRATIRITRDYLKPGTAKDLPTPDYPSSFFTQDVTLYNGSDNIDFTTSVDWWEEKTMIKVAFPLTVSDTTATYEIPFGSIRRSTQWRNSWDSAKVEVPAQRWADLSQADYGVSLLNRSKYGYDVKGNIMRLSLLRSPNWPDPTADRGKHTIEYALFPHRGTWKEALTVRRGYEYNNPLIAVMTDQHKGILSPQHSFLNLTPANVILTTLKKAEDSDAWIVQWYDANGEDTDAVLTLPKTPKKVVTSNFLEEDGPALTATKNFVHVQTRKNGVTTLKVSF
ncbi:MAG: alpha-mannosidase [Ignavibacteriae bacterium]|nr:alpha-mannosidase [Ignavibacteria bacterium]MBI3363840.1 alpha-mannosidase [Ignavibacteriota bacterium]